MVNLRNASSLAEVRERIQKAVVSHEPSQWIIGRGWNHHQWEEQREPTRKDLDDLIPDNPAMMVRACGHSVWVNTTALERTGVTRQTPNPAGGKIDKDADSGEPTGLLREARDIIEAHIPAPTLEDRKQMVLAAQEDALRSGITGVHTCESLKEWEAFAALEAEGKLKVRVYHLLPPDDLEEAADRGITAGFGSERLWFKHVKLFADGSLGSGTALMHAPYSDDPNDCGIAYLEKEILVEKIKLAYSRGCDVAIHAIGDLAVTNALESIAAARKLFPGDHRDRLEHVQLYRPRDLSLFHDLKVVASVQPVFIPTDWAPADRRWGGRKDVAMPMPGNPCFRPVCGFNSAPTHRWKPSIPFMASTPPSHAKPCSGSRSADGFPSKNCPLKTASPALRQRRPGPPGVRISWVPLHRANGRILPFINQDLFQPPAGPLAGC